MRTFTKGEPLRLRSEAALAGGEHEVSGEVELVAPNLVSIAVVLDEPVGLHRGGGLMILSFLPLTQLEDGSLEDLWGNQWSIVDG